MDEKEQDKWTRQGTNVIEIWRLGLKPQWLPTPGELGVSGGSNLHPAPCLSEAVSKKRLSKKYGGVEKNLQMVLVEITTWIAPGW
jgi:hypothetical protein